MFLLELHTIFIEFFWNSAHSISISARLFRTLAATVPDATLSSSCSSRWDISPTARDVVSSASFASNAAQLSTWLLTEGASAIAISATPCASLVASATRPTPDIADSAVCSTSCTCRCATGNPIRKTVHRSNVKQPRGTAVGRKGSAVVQGIAIGVLGPDLGAAPTRKH